MKKHIIGALVVLLLPAVCLAAGEAVVKTGKQSDANITGHVVDAKSGEHLAYATVAVKGTTIGCATDATGHYFLKNLPLGRFTLVASSVGYRSAETTVEIVADRTAEVNFSLNEEALAVEEVVVSASRTETNRKFSPTIVSVASTKLFESTASSNLAETMNFQSGLRVENNCGNCGTTQLRINGLEGQYSQVLLDSRPIFSSLASVYGLEQLPVAMIERVEVIRGGGSALFGANAIGGVVNIIDDFVKTVVKIAADQIASILRAISAIQTNLGRNHRHRALGTNAVVINNSRLGIQARGDINGYDTIGAFIDRRNPDGERRNGLHVHQPHPCGRLERRDRDHRHAWHAAHRERRRKEPAEYRG